MLLGKKWKNNNKHSKTLSAINREGIIAFGKTSVPIVWKSLRVCWEKQQQQHAATTFVNSCVIQRCCLSLPSRPQECFFLEFNFYQGDSWLFRLQCIPVYVAVEKDVAVKKRISEHFQCGGGSCNIGKRPKLHPYFEKNFSFYLSLYFHPPFTNVHDSFEQRTFCGCRDWYKDIVDRQ